jgi:Xaa-Pro aminopeptidase
MYDTVRRSQELAFSLLRPSADCGDLHAAVERFLAAAGYKTRRGRLGLEGFIHATGHGLGLDLHEPPQLGSGSRRLLQAGHVVTIEPGLYYASTGGVRLEDVALVTPQGARNLTEFEKVLEVSRD